MTYTDSLGRNTIAAVLIPLRVIGHHDIVAGTIGTTGFVIKICVIYGPPDSNVEQDPPLTYLLITLFDSFQLCLVWEDFNTNQIDWPLMTSNVPSASFDEKLTTSLQDLIVFQ